jgi:hypothetical protein
LPFFQLFAQQLVLASQEHVTALHTILQDSDHAVTLVLGRAVSPGLCELSLMDCSGMRAVRMPAEIVALDPAARTLWDLNQSIWMQSFENFLKSRSWRQQRWERDHLPVRTLAEVRSGRSFSAAESLFFGDFVAQWASFDKKSVLVLPHWEQFKKFAVADPSYQHRFIKKEILDQKRGIHGIPSKEQIQERLTKKLLQAWVAAFHAIIEHSGVQVVLISALPDVAVVKYPSCFSGGPSGLESQGTDEAVGEPVFLQQMLSIIADFTDLVFVVAMEPGRGKRDRGQQKRRREGSQDLGIDGAAFLLRARKWGHVITVAATMPLMSKDEGGGLEKPQVDVVIPGEDFFVLYQLRLGKRGKPQTLSRYVSGPSFSGALVAAAVAVSIPKNRAQASSSLGQVTSPGSQIKTRFLQAVKRSLESELATVPLARAGGGSQAILSLTDPGKTLQLLETLQHAKGHTLVVGH